MKKIFAIVCFVVATALIVYTRFDVRNTHECDYSATVWKYVYPVHMPADTERGTTVVNMPSDIARVVRPDSVAIFDENGVTQTAVPYVHDPIRPDAVAVEYSAGYANSAEISDESDFGAHMRDGAFETGWKSVFAPETEEVVFSIRFEELRLIKGFVFVPGSDMTADISKIELIKTTESSEPYIALNGLVNYSATISEAEWTDIDIRIAYTGVLDIREIVLFDSNSVPTALVFVPELDTQYEVRWNVDAIPLDRYAVRGEIPDEQIALTTGTAARADINSDADDFDIDGIPNGVDNCPCEENGDQADTDSDGVGDACEAGVIWGGYAEWIAVLLYAIGIGLFMWGKRRNLNGLFIDRIR